MYEISVTRVFCAAHALRLPDGSLEPVHGHNWEAAVTVGSKKLDAMETVMDFHALEQALDRILAPAHSANLNAIAPFLGPRGSLKINPSAERVAWWIGSSIAKTLPKGVKLISTSVTEAPGCRATWRG